MAQVAMNELANALSMNIVPRDSWGAIPPRATDRMTLPVDKVFFSVINEFGYCVTQEECTPIVRTVQKHFLEKGLDDMPYSFVVGNDGNVYEGRGWASKPGPDIQINEAYTDKTIDIGVLVGHTEIVPEKMDLARAAFKQAEDFVKYSIQQNYITKNYEFEGFSDDVKPTGYVPSDEVPAPPFPLTDPSKAPSSCVFPSDDEKDETED